VHRAGPAPRPYLQQALTLARFEPEVYEIVRGSALLVGRSPKPVPLGIAIAESIESASK
jgi:hypothetical protein